MTLVFTFAPLLFAGSPDRRQERACFRIYRSIRFDDFHKWMQTGMRVAVLCFAVLSTKVGIFGFRSCLRALSICGGLA